jgi:hypothetical protein
MTIVGATYQKILIRLMLRSCKLCDIAHDFRADLSIISVDIYSQNLFESTMLAVNFIVQTLKLKY